MRRVQTVVVASAAVVLSACSSTSTKPETSTPSSAPAAHGSLAECLKSHGVTEAGGAPAVLGPPDGIDPGTWDEAMKACSTLAPGPAAP